MRDTNTKRESGREKQPEFTPMMQHYLQTKEAYKDCVLFYRLGDFYEMFFELSLIHI